MAKKREISGIAAVVWLWAGLATAGEPVTAIPINRAWEVLTPPARVADYETYRAVFRQAGELLATWRINVGGRSFDGPRLMELADASPEEPFLRLVRERTRRPFDPLDLLYFLDDVLAAGDRGLRGARVWVPGGRARDAGITLHPDDVFKRGHPRRYAAKDQELNIDKPERPAALPPARDGDLLGPNWSARFRNPGTANAMLAALERESPSGTFADRVRSLRTQVRQQGGDFYLYTTVRSPVRGYLMWGAFMLAHTSDDTALSAGVAKLVRLNREWGLNIPIEWQHPGGPEATREAARAMSDAYDVVYATENGARQSLHYGGKAVDVGILGLPRKLTLEAPDGARETFDLSDPEQARDLNLTPEIIAWLEVHFQLEKLRSDYPHWNDAAPPRVR